MSSYKWFAWGIMVAGIIAIFAGASTPSATWSLWLASIGSAAVGATIGSFFVRLSSEDLAEYVKVTLTKTVSSSFTSMDSEINPIKKKWYHYSVSKKDGELKWRCVILDFSRDPSVGSLNTVVQYIDNENITHEYKVEAAVRGDRLILFYHPTIGNESVAVEIFPFMMNFSQNYSAGTWFHQTWDSSHAFGATIISNKPLLGIKSQGYVPSEKDRDLSDMWVNGIELVDPFISLPGIGSHKQLSHNKTIQPTP